MMNFQNIIKLGIVTNVDNDKRLARVKFPGMGLQDTSGWLPVLISQDVIHYYPYDVPQWTEFDTEDKGPRTGDKDYVDHRHKVIIKPYMPKVGDQVLALYIPIFNADGFILGGIRPWQ